LEKAKVNFGIEITLVLKESLPKEEAIVFYRGLGLPLKKEETKVKKK
jgi:hypothetical protein